MSCDQRPSMKNRLAVTMITSAICTLVGHVNDVGVAGVGGLLAGSIAMARENRTVGYPAVDFRGIADGPPRKTGVLC